MKPVGSTELAEKVLQDYENKKPKYTADHLRQAKVEVLQLAAQRFRGDVGYNPVAADGYANAFDIAAELDYMADEIERSNT